MTRKDDLVAAAAHLDQLPAGALFEIGHDGTGPDPGDIRCSVLLEDGTALAALGDTFEEAARLAVGLLRVPA